MPKKTDGAKSYSQMLSELQKIIDWFEGEEIDLDQAVKKFEDANKLIARLDDYLNNAENKIKKVAGK